MIKHFLFFFILFFNLNSFSQDFISIAISKSYSNFNFKNSQGEKDKTIKAVLKNAYAINYQKLFYNNLFVRAELGAKEMGAYSLYNTQKITWNLNYLDGNIGGGYNIPINAFQVYLGASFYASYLLSGNQTIGANYYDMKKDNTIKKNDLGINLFLGAIYQVSSSTSVFLECTKSNGFYQLDPGPKQKLFNKAIFFRLGFMFEFNEPQRRFTPGH